MQITKNIVLCGMPSCGKSTVGILLSEMLSIPVLDTDAIIVEREGMEIRDIFEKFGEPYFRAKESEVIADVSKRSDCIISVGGGAVMNPANVAELKKNGVVYFLKRSIENLVATNDRPLSSNIEALKALYDKRLPIYESVADVIVENNGKPEAAVDFISKNIK